MSELERRQRLTKSRSGKARVHWATYQALTYPSGYKTLCGQLLRTQESQQSFAAVTCDKCAERAPK